ncbi:LSM12 homolog A-like [Anthonomus grandis grandis]|uniref:LSM12 homolog A-like n=1 Tax=Anthonomus grandis grandis TaxID=2921223 RepID=UPI0021655F38|nr:LSM12 homolog A-like [Anthonomus grandis grandis]
MAGVNDLFTLGSVVWCRTCYNTEVEGEVMAFEPLNKMLILKCASTNGDSKLNDVQFINLSFVSELQVKKEGAPYYDLPNNLNLQRLNTRIRNQVEEKKRMIQAISANVSTEGQTLFIALSKMIVGQVRWRNSDISVWNQEVTISPPYQLANVRGNANSREFKYILKLVEKHLQDLSLTTQEQSRSPQ